MKIEPMFKYQVALLYGVDTRTLLRWVKRKNEHLQSRNEPLIEYGGKAMLSPNIVRDIYRHFGHPDE